VFFLAVTTCFCDDIPPTLTIYDGPSQSGVIANKRFLNRDGSTQKVIYYLPKAALFNGPIPRSESDLIPYQIKLFVYDHSSLVWIGIYRPDFQLIRSADIQYDREGIPVTELTRRSDGSLMRKTLHTGDPHTFKQYIYDENGLNETESHEKRVTDIEKIKIKS